MAKKSRRAKRNVKKSRSVSAVRPKQPVSAPSPVATSVTAVLAEEKASKLTEEYRYVYHDLKRIAILAATMLAVLIVLSFVIR